MRGDYGMYTPDGNALVHRVVEEARRQGWDWDTVERHLRLLARAHPKRAGEATDTAVREIVYAELEHGYSQGFYG